MSQLRFRFALVFKALLMGLCVFTIKPAEAQKYVFDRTIDTPSRTITYAVDIDGTAVMGSDFGFITRTSPSGTLIRERRLTAGNGDTFPIFKLSIVRDRIYCFHSQGLMVLDYDFNVIREVIARRAVDPRTYQLEKDLSKVESVSSFAVGNDGRIQTVIAPVSTSDVWRLLTFSSAGDYLFEEVIPTYQGVGQLNESAELVLLPDGGKYFAGRSTAVDKLWNLQWSMSLDVLPSQYSYFDGILAAARTADGYLLNVKMVWVPGVSGVGAVKTSILILNSDFGILDLIPMDISIRPVRSILEDHGWVYIPTIDVDTGTKYSVQVYRETTSPTIQIEYVPSLQSGYWSKSPLAVKVLGKDNYVVTSIEYVLDGLPSSVMSSDSTTIYVTAEGRHTLTAKAVDNTKNSSAPYTTEFGIDYQAPTTATSISNGKLSISASDSLSGVKAIYTLVEGGIPTVYTQPIPLPANGKKVIYWSEDNASNVEVAKSYPPADGSLAISSFSTSPQSSVGGRTISSTITLSTAQSTPTTINLGSDNASVVVPASITIDAGQTSKTFTIETKPVGAYTQTNITATLGTQTRTAQLDLLPPTARIRISPPVVSSESTAKATITLSGNAPVGGLVVELESDESAASVPSSITIPEGQKTATFNIVAGKVTEETYAYITATIDGVSSEASLTIRPKSIKPTTLSITESLVGGANGTGTITLSDPAPEGGLDVDLATNNAAVSLPLVVKVAEGSKTANFSFSTSAVSNTITATVSAKANGATVTDTIEVKVRPLGTLVASPSTLPGKATGTLTLTLSSPTTTPLTVNVSSSNAAVVLASKTITIAKGQSSGILKFTTALVGTDTTSTITCLSNGLEAKTDITVRSAKPSNVSLLPSVVLGGKGSVGTVTIDSAAPTSGLTVALSSSDSSAVVPSFVLVPSGKTTATFTITTSKVTSSKNVTITASANGVSKTATLGVRILTIASISFNPVSVEGGVKANAFLTLTDVAPLGGITVTVGSDKAGVTVPTSLVVPAGKNSVAFVASTSVTGSSYDAKVTGTANGETGSGTLKVLAPAVSSFALSSTSVKGGDKPLGTVKIAKASTVDVVVNLSSSNAAVASVPATVTIPKGQLLATFQVTTTKPSVASSVTLSATTGGLAKVVVLKVSP